MAGKFLFSVLMAMLAINVIYAEDGANPAWMEVPHERKFHISVHGSYSRQAQAHGDGIPEQGGEEHQDRISISPSSDIAALVPCNFSAQPGPSCSSCSQTLRCLPNNVGIIRSCRGNSPYCNSGRCSFFPENNCTPSNVYLEEENDQPQT